MRRPSDHVENMIGRRWASCLGWALLVLSLLMIAAVIWSRTRPAENNPAPPAVEKQ
jgi:hypothetical protein